MTVLKKMKNNKSLGTDGFTLVFFFFFSNSFIAILKILSEMQSMKVIVMENYQLRKDNALLHAYRKGINQNSF